MLNNSHKNVTCATCLVRKDSLFGSYCDNDTDHLNAHKSCTYYKKNQPLFLEGSFPRGVYCLNHGKVKVFTRGDEGKEQIIHIAKEGEVIGFRSMFSGEPYTMSAETLEESNICFISKDDFLNMVDTNPILRNGVMRELSKELSDRALALTNMAQKSVRERLAFSLVMLDDIYAGEEINLSREDMANFVGTATETLIRLLKEFKEDGLLEIHVRKLAILDKVGLRKIAGMH
jgi:CRP-like cAMP-binding protein|tara:strand:- start:52010 stop:52702 length:693 start_codon:yes stop_codon:yes gene_type:complete